MARISINNLQADDFNSSLISLGDQENDLVKAAVERALDARRIGGGLSAITAGGRIITGIRTTGIRYK